jgi:hypothetical protein
MSEAVSIFGRYVDLPPIGRKGWRVQKRLFAAKIKTRLIGRRFSGAENLLHLLSKHDLYFYGVSLIPRELTPRVLRRAQREQHSANLPSLTVDEVANHARSEADSLSHQTLEIEHLLLALLHYDRRSAALLTQHGVDYEKARGIVLARGIAGHSITLLGFPRLTFYRNKMK